MDPDRLARMRDHGTQITEAIERLAVEVGVNDPLDRLAFVTGTMRTPDPATGLTPPFTLRFHEAKTAAREQGHTWAEISEAMGEGSDGRAARRVRARYLDNQARLDEQRSEAPS